MPKPNPEETAGTLVDWRVSYAVEALGATRSIAEIDAARALLARSPGWVLIEGERLLSYSTFNARARGMVQVGGVFTPPELRGRGYGRAVVAGSLLHARQEGATRSVLFTPRSNLAAQRAILRAGVPSDR